MGKNIKKSPRIFLLILSVSLMPLIYVPTHAQDTVVITLSPTELNVGDTGIVDARIDCPSQQCSMFSATIQFDPELIRVDSARVGPYMGDSATGQVFVAANDVDNISGTVLLSAVNISESTLISDNLLFQIQVTAIALGNTVMQFTQLDFRDRSGNPLVANGVEGIVRVRHTSMTPNNRAAILGLVTQPLYANEGLDRAIREGVIAALVAKPTITVAGRNFPIHLNTEMVACSHENGREIAASFVEDPHVVGVIGPTCAPVCIGAVPIFEAAGYTTISPICTSPALTALPLQYFNWMLPVDELRGKFITDFVYNDLGLRRLAVVYDSNSLNEQIARRVIEEFTWLGGSIVMESVLRTDETDFHDLLENVAEQSPDLIFVAASLEQASSLVVQRRGFRLHRIPILGTDPLYSPEFILEAGQDENVFVVYSGATEDQPGTVLAALSASNVPGSMMVYWGAGYDAATILLRAVEATSQIDDGGNLIIDRTAVAAYVREAESVEGTVSGNGELLTANVRIFLLQDGLFSEVKRFDGAYSPVLRDEELGGACTVHTTRFYVPIHVGPDPSRPVRATMPANFDFIVTGGAIASDSSAWWRLEAPMDSFQSDLDGFWVRQSDVETSGNCDAVPQVPPWEVLPILPADEAPPPASPIHPTPQIPTGPTNEEPDEPTWPECPTCAGHQAPLIVSLPRS